jgi:hypothetical protein
MERPSGRKEGVARPSSLRPSRPRTLIAVVTFFQVPFQTAPKPPAPMRSLSTSSLPAGSVSLLAASEQLPEARGLP